MLRLSIAAVSLAAAVAAGQTPLTSELVVSGLTHPIWVGHAPGDASRLFIIEKRGLIRIVKDGVLLPTPFLDIDSIVGGGTTFSSEQGLLGLAFHPKYASNGSFFVNYTNNSNNTVIARYSVSADPDVADAGSALQLMEIVQPFTNHNGGWIGFGPDDGLLHIATGDGGSGCDPFQNAQNTNNLLGKILRIDVDKTEPPKNYAIPPDNPFAQGGGSPEIWVYGLRNPWRDSFDRETGDLYIADVGQGAVEEVNYKRAGTPGGENYGWDCMEGNSCSTVSGCTVHGCACGAAGLVAPIHTYQHFGGGGFNCSVTGGYVYRGCAIPDLQGTYFFADYCSAKIWSFRTVAGAVTEFTDRTAELDPPGALAINDIVSFGEDALGELYICDQNGEVFRIVAADGSNKCPEPCFADCNEDGSVNIFDFLCFQGKVTNGDISADCNGDSMLNIFDFLCMQGKVTEGCG
jgi:glucose/arabinose dehydrogenase